MEICLCTHETELRLWISKLFCITLSSHLQQGFCNCNDFRVLG